MPVVVNSRSKLLCRLILYMLKIIPYVIAVGYIAYTGFTFYNMDLPFIRYIVHLSVLPWLFLYLSSLAFKFCYVHRLPLYYILINDSITVLDYYLGIPLDVYQLMMLHSVILGLLTSTTTSTVLFPAYSIACTLLIMATSSFSRRLLNASSCGLIAAVASSSTI